MTHYNLHHTWIANLSFSGDNYPCISSILCSIELKTLLPLLLLTSPLLLSSQNTWLINIMKLNSKKLLLIFAYLAACELRLSCFSSLIFSDFFLLCVLITDTAFLHWYSLWVLWHFLIFQKNCPNSLHSENIKPCYRYGSSSDSQMPFWIVIWPSFCHYPSSQFLQRNIWA